MRKVLLFIFFLFTALSSLNAELWLEPVKWTQSQDEQSSEYVVIAKIDKGWHLYSTDLPEGGPVATTFFADERQLTVRELSEKKTSYDDMFELDLSYFEREARFAIDKADIQEGETLSVYYMACNDETCLAPTTVVLNKGDVEASVVETETNLFPQIAPQASMQNEENGQHSLWWIFLMGLLGGLLAIFTPCVWPIIPMTISFFMKRAKKGKAVKEALLYGLSIIIIYVGLGLLVTLIFGASALNSISTNAVVNLVFFAILLLFAFSFFGAFEITLPSSWSTKMDTKATNTTGFLSILFMAFTLVIVSFSCTGPIIGTLLVEAAGESLLAPTIGMLGFAIALALPFSLFALFPDLMRRVPRSGGWMDSFKVTLAFLELALSLKFLSVADLAYGWHILDRETFIALWIVIFALLGLYLLGVFHFNHEQKTEGISVTRFMLAVVSLSFAMYMVPGLWGAPLKAISAFAPPMFTQDFVMTESAVAHQENRDMNDYEAAFAQAQRDGKEVLLDFSGYGCVNCRKMEAKVLSNSRVADRLQHFVVVTLMVDDKTRLDEPYTVTENGREVQIKTVGDQWSYLQRSRFGANAQPYYVRMSADGVQKGEAYSYNEDIDKFLKWLE